MKNKSGIGRMILWVAAGLLFAPMFLRADPVSRQPARTSPAWLREGVIYEIFPRDFSPAGNLNGVTARLDELQSLGVNILWVMPIHPIGEKARKGEFGSPYSVRDYYAVDPNYGTLDDFKKLVAGAHQRGMKVIMDLVANHTAWDSVLMQHPEFYKQDASGKPMPPVPEWTDVAGLNYANPQLREYMITMMQYWVRTCDIDGFRCDVAYMVPTDFWVQARTALEKIKPDIMLLAEAGKPELLVNAFDLDYDWPLLSTLNDVLIRGAPASDLEATWEKSRREFPLGALHLRISDNHDEARAVARYGVRGALAASALMFTLDGVPLLYNGMEVGDATESGDPALFDKLTIFWQPKERPPLRKIYRGLIDLRKQYPCFENDRVTWLQNSDENDVVTFMRADDQDEFVVVINLSNRPVAGRVELKDDKGFQPVRIAGLPDGNTDGLPAFRLNGFEWRIYHRAK
ncbi:MAG TPA: alpha-amylase family glycosyl hydrolase [Verrucomicrobiae bacterium]|nr:alpha-amylase family glycosyl hydrolase [Verrucomicrobiae bacterium]